MSEIRAWARMAADRAVVRRSLGTAIVVGTTLTAINHGDDLVHGRTAPDLGLQIALTYLVPYLVATVSSVAATHAGRADHAHDTQVLERQIAAINKFPDRNPNPVLRVDADGHLTYANAASAEILVGLGAAVGETVPAETLAALQTAAASTPPDSIEVASGRRTFAVVPHFVPELDVMNLYGTDVTGNKVVDKFPDRNPNPVLRMSLDGRLIYANAASAPILSALGLAMRAPLPADLLDRLRAILAGTATEPVEVQGQGRTFLLDPVLIPEFEFVNLYGTDVTALRAFNRFPDRNPNPVMRVDQDGTLVYANRASALLLKALEAQVGERLPADVFRRIEAAIDAPEPEILDVTAEGRIFELLVVSVYEFSSINLYGTDVTAAREIEKAHRENERLLLNILPASIAERLRRGESVIADRFDEMSVLFADVVGFTQLSTRLSPTEVVELLNRVFSAFDQLVDASGLEKIKTIGDAYMVVGGLNRDGADHVRQVAEVGLRMIDAVAAIDEGPRLQIRVGMHFGPAVAGVIGIKKFIYDVWGDTVNTASRMESSGLPGRLQVTEATYQRLQDIFVCEPRGTIEVRGKGPMATYFLTARSASRAEPEVRTA